MKSNGRSHKEVRGKRKEMGSSLNTCSFQVITSQRAEKHERRRGSSRWCTQSEGKHFLAYQSLEDGEDKQHPVWS